MKNLYRMYVKLPHIARMFELALTLYSYLLIPHAIEKHLYSFENVMSLFGAITMTSNHIFIQYLLHDSRQI